MNCRPPVGSFYVTDGIERIPFSVREKEARSYEIKTRKRRILGVLTTDTCYEIQVDAAASNLARPT